MPELFEVVALNKDGHENLPEPTVPYYVLSDEGHFLHKRTEIGDAILRDHRRPRLAKLGYPGGIFTWRGDKVPATIISQAHDFFLRIFNTKHSEAEVIITKHVETGQFRLFVPYQRVSHMGVKSIFEPTHISHDWLVVGTLHSHCDFGAFHSSTDTGDASDMDGAHFTIGKVNQPIPEIAAMVMMNGKQFDYDVTDIAEVDFGGTTAPPWWDQFVFANGEAPNDKPRGLVSVTQEDWNEFLGRALRTPKVEKAHVVSSPQRWTPRPGLDWTRGRERMPTYPQQMLGDGDWRREVYGAGARDASEYGVRGGYGSVDDETITDPVIMLAIDEAERLLVWTDYDWDDIPIGRYNDITYFQEMLTKRLTDIAGVLNILNVAVTVTATEMAAPKKGEEVNFRETIAAIAYRPNQVEATGLLAPIIRATGHILYVTAALAVEAEEPEAYHLTDEEALRELTAAAGHLSRTVATTEAAPVSNACKQHVILFCDAVRLAGEEYPLWSDEDRGPSLKDLADRAAQLGAFLDGELAGLRGSDPGRTL